MELKNVQLVPLAALLKVTGVMAGQASQIGEVDVTITVDGKKPAKAGFFARLFRLR